MQTKCKKCIIKILIYPRTQDVDLKNSLHLLWILNRFCCLSDMWKIFEQSEFTSWLRIGFNTRRGLEMITHLGSLNELPPCLLVVWSIVLVACPLTCTCACNMAMNHEKGGRQMAERVWVAANKRLGRWFIDDCKDCTEAGKKNAFTSECKNFQRSALVTPYAWHRLSYSVYLILSKINHTLVKSWVVNTLM